MSERPVHEYIKELSEALVQLSEKVLQNFNEALYAVTHKDVQTARKIRIIDDEIDEAEVRLEEQCLEFLALHQPVARDLRSMVTIIKINDDLERIGDLAVHIIERMPELGQEVMERYEFEKMGILSASMVRKAIEAFINRDRPLADKVCAMDEEVDTMHRSVFKKVADAMKACNTDTEQLLAVLSVSRYIERMADHATRIALEVIYLVTGEIVRHSDDTFEKLIQSLKD
ncbi:phosphate transport system regulatory protein PhoU [Chlorobaculum limnaeum]|uniref:Phosphate-specific transport system accessory protein PhoU n=1 Tax=Chlorobaculum limnaeum TaxID=274537 RepID=A0A1D8D410_CHLLM|nr:phosphate signaling complex protein PhoU [Chlorobaculum limnaeum]AOS83837.1 phosphate transport system regulatory protein PhoU [Chlorobaculum limnaeum]